MGVGIWKVNKQEGPAIYSKGLRKVGGRKSSPSAVLEIV